MKGPAFRLPKSLRKTAIAAIVVSLAFGLGYFTAGDKTTPQPHPTKAISLSDGHDHTEQAKQTWWTCSMHPQIRLPNPGKCPICFMELIPLDPGKQDAALSNMTRYTMSETAKKLAEVETAEVKRARADVEVRMLGLVYEDETKVAALTARVDGRLDEIYINFTGVHVSRGDPMVKIWSPTLIKSQVELFETMKGSEIDASVNKGAEEKLIQYGLTPEQLLEIKKKKKPVLYITLKAPINGVVTKKMAVLGQFVKEGSEMYIINDLSHVWIKLDAYETDLPWIRYGQKVTFTTSGIPGRTFEGRVLFIDPVVDTKTRSVKVRVEADNPDLALKPGMFVTAKLEAEIDSQGKVIKSEWAGKYVCPVHPRDEASPAPGECPESKMPLRPAASFGYSDNPNPEKPLVIPATAPLITGTRAVVYVEVPSDQPTYDLHEIVLGPRAGNNYVVYGGLKEGERVVSKGNFKIDSAMQILARSSMMNKTKQPEKQPAPQEEVVSKIAVNSDFLVSLNPLIEGYMLLKDALVANQPEQIRAAANRMEQSAAQVKTDLLNEKAKLEWSKLFGTISEKLKLISETDDIEANRRAFDPLSENFAKLLMAFRHAMPGPLYLYNCPEAFNNRGAYWLQISTEVKNPYSGDKSADGKNLITCGELEETIPQEASNAPKTEESQKSPQNGASSPAGASDAGAGPHSAH